MEHQWCIAGWIMAAFIFYLFMRGSKMIDINALQKEVESELQDEQNKKAKKALLQNARDIASAKQLLANLERQKQDILVQIGDGTL
jgi:hypothetical protein